MFRFLDCEQLRVRFPGTTSTPADDEFDVDGGSAQLYSPRPVFAAPRSMIPKPASLALQRAVQQGIQQGWPDKMTQVDGVWEFNPYPCITSVCHLEVLSLEQTVADVAGEWVVPTPDGSHHMTFAGSNADAAQFFGGYAQSKLKKELLAASAALQGLGGFQPRMEANSLQQMGNGNLCLMLQCVDHAAWNDELHKHQKHVVRKYGLTMPGTARSAKVSGHITLALAKPKRRAQDRCVDWKGSIYDRCGNWEKIPQRELETLALKISELLQQAPLRLGPPTLCLAPDMMRFVPWDGSLVAGTPAAPPC